MIEEIKYRSIFARMDNGEFDRAFVMNTYADGEIWLADVESTDFENRTLPCPATSRVKGASQAVERKPCVCFKKYCKVNG